VNKKMKMKTAVSILLLLLVAAVAQAENDTASPSSSTVSTTVTTIQATSETLREPPTTLRLPEEITVPANMTTTTNNIPPIPTLYTVNQTDNESVANQTEETTTTTLEVTTTTIEIPTTTLPPEPTTTLAPVCGNLYQEVSACGAGRWECTNCKCVQLPEPTTTTTTLEEKSIIQSVDVSKMDSNTLYIIGGFAVLLVIIVLVIWKIGGKEDEEHKPKLN
jgi:hypothetical protein